MAVSDQLREAIVRSELTHYRISQQTGIDTRTLDRFVSGEAPRMMSHNIDRLCEYLGLELQPVKKRSTAAKQGGKKRSTAGKQAAKKPSTGNRTASAKTRKR